MMKAQNNKKSIAAQTRELEEILARCNQPHARAACRRAVVADYTEAIFWAKQYAKAINMNDKLVEIWSNAPTKINNRLNEKREQWQNVQTASRHELYKLMQ